MATVILRGSTVEPGPGGLCEAFIGVAVGDRFQTPEGRFAIASIQVDGTGAVVVRVCRDGQVPESGADYPPAEVVDLITSGAWVRWRLPEDVAAMRWQADQAGERG